MDATVYILGILLQTAKVVFVGARLKTFINYAKLQMLIRDSALIDGGRRTYFRTAEWKITQLNYFLNKSHWRCNHKFAKSGHSLR